MIVIDNETWVAAHAAINKMLSKPEQLSIQQHAIFKAAKHRLEIAGGVADEMNTAELPYLLKKQG